MKCFRQIRQRRCGTGLSLCILRGRGSWLNMAEIELNVLTGQCLNRRIDDIEIVRKEVAAWQKFRNNKNAKVNWQFTTENARIKLPRLYQTLES